MGPKNEWYALITLNHLHAYPFEGKGSWFLRQLIHWESENIVNYSLMQKLSFLDNCLLSTKMASETLELEYGVYSIL